MRNALSTPLQYFGKNSIFTEKTVLLKKKIRITPASCFSIIIHLEQLYTTLSHQQPNRIALNSESAKVTGLRLKNGANFWE
jgi:mannitol/fructose-specific phosphotransferase system IIA component (Ntr-type)